MQLRDYVQAVKEGRVIVLVVTVLAVVLGGLLVLTQDSRSLSTARLYVATQVESADPDVLLQRNAVAQQRLASYVEVIGGDVLARQIAEDVGGEIDTSEDDIDVSVLPGTSIIEIEVLDDDADRARTVAAAYADAVPGVVRELERSDEGGWDVVARVIDEADEGEPVDSRSPLVALLLAALLGIAAGAAAACLWWAVRRELAAAPDSPRV
ncbi:hypothetical protein [Nocardioides aequoreus]|uniref:hypothetical protein n=1 Tax=Nocardioides aequoreus TaxID=397278 RepID=UPI0004C39A70|nr:hypothetical protein [Nocardioides aequoreus]